MYTNMISQSDNFFKSGLYYTVVKKCSNFCFYSLSVAIKSLNFARKSTFIFLVYTNHGNHHFIALIHKMFPDFIMDVHVK